MTIVVLEIIFVTLHLCNERIMSLSDCLFSPLLPEYNYSPNQVAGRKVTTPGRLEVCVWWSEGPVQS